MDGNIRGSKPYECDICGKNYKGRSGLLYHKSFVHEGKKPFSCDYCDRTFTNKKFALVHECDNKPPGLTSEG